MEMILSTGIIQEFEKDLQVLKDKYFVDTRYIIEKLEKGDERGPQLEELPEN